jgi:6-phosphogluconolactonase (cycloisomerase 2 family)
MKRSLQFFAYLSYALIASNAFSQAVAYVYVANNPKNSSTNEISAFSVAKDGRLTPIAGSPFREDVQAMAVAGSHLVAVSRSQPNLDTFAIESEGALRYLTSSDYATHSGGSDCAIANQIFFDHTGTNLYVQEFDADCSNTGVASFTLNKTNGALKYLGIDITGAFPGDDNAASFLGNNVYGYTAVNSYCMYYGIYGFRRQGNGLLVSGGALQNYPAATENIGRFVPELLAADPTNHLALLVQPANPPDCTSGAPQLASYTVSSSGTLSTRSTSSNMPATLVTNPWDLKMSPSGKLLAIAGQQGLQVFHFNGANPITHDTGLLTTDPVNEVFWDNSNHLYAISQTTGKIRVYTITPSSYQLAPGSPRLIDSPERLIVQSLAHP